MYRRRRGYFAFSAQGAPGGLPPITTTTSALTLPSLTQTGAGKADMPGTGVLILASLTQAGVGSHAGGPDTNILLESGDNSLLENGDFILLEA
jgi:hypothetical protein